MYISLMDDDFELTAAVVACAIAAGAIWFFDGKTSPVDYGAFYRLDVEQSTPLYLQAKRDGPPMLACAHAGVVAAALTRLGEMDSAREWARLEEKACKRVRLN
jgi:hypothetical protein